MIASTLDTKIHVENEKSNFSLMVDVRLGILNEHVQHLFAICQQISLNSVFSENGQLIARNPLKFQRRVTIFKNILPLQNYGMDFRFSEKKKKQQQQKNGNIEGDVPDISYDVKEDQMICNVEIPTGPFKEYKSEDVPQNK